MNITTARLANDVMRTTICLLLLAICIPVSAQTTQKGIVKEYNEKAQKTPLAGVELNVRSAGSAVSDKNGNFSLNFLTLKAGDRINVRNVKKEGFEIFNKESIEQWNLNPNAPFTIVMCSSAKFKAICDKIYANNSESYRKQYEKESQYINKLKREGKIKEEEFNRRLIEIQEIYDRQLDNLDNYVDRFARIDLSELSAEEEEIIELIHEGKIEEAIERYNEHDYVAMFSQEVDDLKKISVSIEQMNSLMESKQQSRDSILQKAFRKIDTFLMSGKKENREQAIAQLHTIADKDTTNIPIQAHVGYFFMEFVCDTNEAIKHFQRALTNSIKTDGPFNIRNADLYYSMHKCADVNHQLEYLDKALDIYTQVLGADCDELITVYNSYSDLYQSRNDFETAIDYTKKALELCENTSGLETSLAAGVYNNLGNVYYLIGDYDDALESYSIALSIWNNLKFGDMNTNFSSWRSIMILCGNLSEIFLRKQQPQEALEWAKMSVEMAEKVYGKSHPETAQSCLLVGSAYSSLGEFELSNEQIHKALIIFKDVYGIKNGHIVSAYRRLAANHNNFNYWNKALEYYALAKESCTNEDLVLKALVDTDMGYTYLLMGNYDSAINSYKNGVTALENELDAPDMRIGWGYYYMGICFGYKKEFAYALECYRSYLKILNEIVGLKNEDAANAYLEIGKVYNELEQYDNAITNLEKAKAIYEQLKDSYINIASCDNYIAYAFHCKAQYNEALDYYKKSISLCNVDVHKNWHMIAKNYCGIGAVCASTNNSQKALENWEQALNAIPTEYIGQYMVEYSCLKYIANTLFDAGDYDNAISFYEKAYAFSKRKNIDESYGILPPYYNSIHKLKKLNESNSKHLSFIKKEAIPIMTVIENGPAHQMGLSGEYFVMAFEDWDIDDAFSLYDINDSFRGKTKTITLMKDGKISTHHFQNQIGAKIGIKAISEEEKIRIVKNFNNWKSSVQ